MDYYTRINFKNRYDENRVNRLLGFLGMKRNYIPRFRNAWRSENHIYIYTRTGGDAICDDYGLDGTMRKHKLYVDEYENGDDDYIIFRYRIPDKRWYELENVDIDDDSD